MADRFALEEKALASFIQLMQSARECRGLYEVARLPIPDRLRRFLEEEGHTESKVTIPPPEPPAATPTGWNSSWIWVPVSELTTTSLVRGVLRGASKPLTPKEIGEQIAALGISYNKGSIANIGTRLSNDGELGRADGAWFAAHPDRYPILSDGYAWGLRDIFDKQEVAAYRRLALLHVLAVQHDGMQAAQITKTLAECGWLNAPMNKDLVKEDIIALQEAGKIKRTGGATAKWRVA